MLLLASLSIFLFLPQMVVAHPFFNSSEKGCDGSDPSVLLCDDFEDGDWAQSNCDFPVGVGGRNHAPNDGWCMNIYFHNADGSTTNGSLGNGFNPPVVPGYAVCSGAGVGGVGCAATSAPRTTPSPSSAGMMGSHGFVGDREVDELYFRLYFKHLPGYVGGHEKMFDIIMSKDAPPIMALSYNYFGSGRHCAISYLHQDDSILNGNSWMCPNVGADLTPQTGKWYYVEYRYKMNTPGSYDGIYEMWMNDCGANGICSGTPTLRAQYKNVKFRSASEGHYHMGGIWIENWGNAGSIGTTYYDQIYVATRPIGFSGSAAPPSIAIPIAPRNLRVR